MASTMVQSVDLAECKEERHLASKTLHYGLDCSTA
jgi:hypothetical protein